MLDTTLFGVKHHKLLHSHIEAGVILYWRIQLVLLSCLYSEYTCNVICTDHLNKIYKFYFPVYKTWYLMLKEDPKSYIPQLITEQCDM